MIIESKPEDSYSTVTITGFNKLGEELTEEVRIPADGTPVATKNIFWPPKALKENKK